MPWNSGGDGDERDKQLGSLMVRTSIVFAGCGTLGSVSPVESGPSLARNQRYIPLINTSRPVNGSFGGRYGMHVACRAVTVHPNVSGGETGYVGRSWTRIWESGRDGSREDGRTRVGDDLGCISGTMTRTAESEGGARIPRF